MKDSTVQLLKDDKELSLEEWNREVNAIQPMSILEKHPNLLIRLKEEHRRKSFLKLIELQKNFIIADVGCEAGYLTERMIERCRSVYCIDIDKNMLEKAKERIGNDRTQYVHSDIQNINLQDNLVDVAIAAEVLEHLPDPAVGIKELARITKPGGKIYISVPNEPLVLFIKSILSSMGMKWFMKNLNKELAIGHLKVFNKAYLTQICMGIVELERIFYNKPFYLNIFAIMRPKKVV